MPTTNRPVSDAELNSTDPDEREDANARAIAEDAREWQDAMESAYAAIKDRQDHRPIEIRLRDAE